MKDAFVSQNRSSKLLADGQDPAARDVLGIAIRRWGSSWRQQTLFTFLSEVVNDPSSEETISMSYNKFLKHISDLGLMEAYEFKPIVDGTTITKALSAKPGPWLSGALEIVMAWQLLHPDVINAEKVIATLKPDLEKQVAATPALQSKSELPSRLAHHFLSSTLRPIFAQSEEQKKHSAVTATGHKNTRILPPPRATLGMDRADAAKAWKGKAPWAFDLLQWSIAVLDSKGVETNWPLLIPPIMALLDDIDVSWKAKGVQSLNLLLDRTSPQLLARTGLGDIFEKELFPLFTYLPTLTPEEQSIDLLNAVFPTLLSLANTLHPPSATQLVPSTNLTKPRTLLTPSRAREKFLDSIMRKGIFAPYFHAQEHVAITSTLLTHLIPLLNAQGLTCVKHLKDLLPMLSDILSNPLGLAYPPLLLKAVVALQAVIQNGGPRMDFHQGGVLRGLCVCWTRIENDGEERDEVGVLRGELRRAVEMLKEAVKKEGAGVEGFKVLVEADARLEGLLQLS